VREKKERGKLDTQRGRQNNKKKKKEEEEPSRLSIFFLAGNSNYNLIFC